MRHWNLKYDRSPEEIPFKLLDSNYQYIASYHFSLHNGAHGISYEITKKKKNRRDPITTEIKFSQLFPESFGIALQYAIASHGSIHWHGMPYHSEHRYHLPTHTPFDRSFREFLNCFSCSICEWVSEWAVRVIDNVECSIKLKSLSIFLLKCWKQAKKKK